MAVRLTIHTARSPGNSLDRTFFRRAAQVVQWLLDDDPWVDVSGVLRH